MLMGDGCRGINRLIIAVVLLVIITWRRQWLVWYGITHDTLPGGKSMLVRWEYWVGAARIYAAHPLTGAGPGSFADYYPTYKIPAALETVKDPHNFILSILTQYGPLGPCRIFDGLACAARMHDFFNRRQQSSGRQDAFAQFKKMAMSFSAANGSRAAGDTAAGAAKRIRELPPAVMMVVITLLYVVAGGDICGGVFIFIGK